MARSFRNWVLPLGIAIVAGTAGISFGQVMPETPATPAAASPTNLPGVDKAIDLFKQRKYDEAAKILKEEHLKNLDALPPAQVVMYLFFAQSNQAGLARTALDNAATESPDDPESFVILGNAALQEHRLTDADLLFTRATELLKKFHESARRKGILEPQAISGMAAVAENRAQWSIAENYLNALLALNPKDTIALQRIARADFWEKKPGDALKRLREAKAADVDKNGKALNTVVTPEAALGKMYEQYPDHADAIIWMGKALVAAPDDVNTHLVVAMWALETGDPAMAGKEADRAMEIDSKSLDAKILRGIVALFDKKYGDAERWFQDAHLQSPGNFAASNNLALALCEQGDPAKLERALEYATINYQQNSKNSDACATLGWVLYKKKDMQRAEMALRQAFQSGTLNADTAYYLARVSYESGRADGKTDAKTLLNFIMQANKPFSMKPEATALLKQIDAEAPAPKKNS